MKTFDRSFTQQAALPEEAITRALQVLRSGSLHRYDQDADGAGETARLEEEFAGYLGLPYCLACASGGYALHIALRSIGIGNGAPVLCNAFTLSPVPGAIHNAGGTPVLVETGPDCTIDVADLERAAAESGAGALLLTHMRGHIGDMAAIQAVCDAHGMTLVEDCAHTMGARWRGRKSGTFGRVACFSTQTYKHLNSGEGGLLVSADAEVMRRAVIMSGSYMHYGSHRAAPPAESFAAARLDTPNYSGRMDNLRAAILRPQLRHLDAAVAQWNARYAILARRLDALPDVSLPARAAHEEHVGSSIQFSLPGYSAERIRRFLALTAQRGVALAWYGDPEPRGFTSRYDSWRYLGDTRPLPATRRLLATLCDMRIPLSFTTTDCELIADILGDSLHDSGDD